MVIVSFKGASGPDPSARTGPDQDGYGAEDTDTIVGAPARWLKSDLNLRATSRVRLDRWSEV